MLTPDNLRSIRLGFGIEPKFIDTLYGRKVSMDVKKGTPMNWDILK